MNIVRLVCLSHRDVHVSLERSQPTAGNHMPDLFRIRTLVCKVIGTERRPAVPHSFESHREPIAVRTDGRTAALAAPRPRQTSYSCSAVLSSPVQSSCLASAFVLCLM